MVKLMRLLPLIFCTIFMAGCLDDASVSEIKANASNELITGDDGEILDEIPMDEEEALIDEILLGDDLEEDPVVVVEEEEEPAEDPVVVVEEEEEVEEEVIIVEEEEEEPAEDPVVVVEEEEEEYPDREIASEEEPKSCEKRASLSLFKMDNSSDHLGNIQSFKGPFSTKVNYNYYSVSAHPIVGPKPEEYEGHFFFYEGSDGLSLNFFYNIDAGGSAYNKVKVDFSIKGNSAADDVMISDDRSELKRSPSLSNDASMYQARMQYWYNTDGGAIGPLKGKDFKIHVKMYEVGDNKRVAFYSADGRSIILENISEAPHLYSEFVIEYKGHSEFCDDGIKDENMACFKDAYHKNQKGLADSNWRAKWDSARDDRKQKLVDLAAAQKAEVKTSRDQYNAERKAMRLEIKSERKSLIDDIREKRRALASDMKDARKALRDALKAKRKDALDDHRKQIKSFNGDKKERKAFRNSLKDARKMMHAEHKKIMKDFNHESKKEMKHFNYSAKKHMKEFNHIAHMRMKDFNQSVRAKLKMICNMFKSERKILADGLMKKMRENRSRWIASEKDVKESFVKEIAMCRKD